jgi:predicted transcriptional regulator
LSNLKEYVTILGTVANNTPSNLAHLAALIAMDYNKLLDALDFLCIQGCLALAASEVKTASNYSITERGLRILEFFK